MPYRRIVTFLFAAALLASPLLPPVSARSAVQTPAGQETILKAADITPKIFPEHVFYRGRVAPVQMRNTGGVHFADDLYWLAGLVDVSGYSSGVREKYQGYFLTEVPLDVSGRPLKPGAYGFGFVEGPRFIVTDLGSNNVLEVAAHRDAELKGPMPLQVVAGQGGAHRLYVGRDYVTVKRGK